MTQINQTAVIIDNGSGIFKAGFTGDNIPRVIFPQIIGKDKELEDIFIGNEALAKKLVLKFEHPIENGIITNWDNMEKIWNHCFYNELHAIPEEHPCLMTEAPMTPKKNREKMTQIIFEKFSIPQFFVQIPAVLSLCASGRNNGIVVDSGDSLTCAIPIYNLYALSDALMYIYFGGRDLNDYLKELLAIFDPTTEQEIVRDIKEKLAYVALDFQSEITIYSECSENNKEYELPDGSSLILGNERFKCPEIIFKPLLVGKQFLGIHELAFNSIMKSDIDLRKELFKNIVISGGNTMFQGLDQRLYKEISNLTQPNLDIEVIAPQERKISAWIGGSILSQLSSFKSMWITKKEYEEYGEGIVHRKCY